MNSWTFALSWRRSLCAPVTLKAMLAGATASGKDPITD